MPLSERFIGKYMRQAKQLGEDRNPCYSRKLGVVLVKIYGDGEEGSRVVGTGYNGPPRKTPHCDERDYLNDIVWPQLTFEEKTTAMRNLGHPAPEAVADWNCKAIFLDKASNCGRCPRKLIGAPSGQRLELCSCAHAEQNAIANAGEDLHGCWAFCWCGVACWECAKMMINAGLKKAYFVDDGTYGNGKGSDYSFGSRWLLGKAKLEIEVHPPEVYLA
jgi:deoxycytidylate deaminase